MKNILEMIDDAMCKTFKFVGADLCKWIKWVFLLLLVLLLAGISHRLL